MGPRPTLASALQLLLQALVAAMDFPDFPDFPLAMTLLPWLLQLVRMVKVGPPELPSLVRGTATVRWGAAAPRGSRPPAAAPLILGPWQPPILIVCMSMLVQRPTPGRVA